ncbi:MAG: PilZ domain-containing protein [Bdellovibrionaceae bacterium]|nr:PilZ domain-containing protein [Pseudobdellovibrionaceae bacterium]
MTHKWFTQKKNKINGPYNLNQIEALIENSQDDILIWGQGMAEWLTPNDWKVFLSEKQKVNDSQREIPSWKFRINDTESQDLTFKELINELKKQKEFDLIYFKNKEQPKWTSIFSSVVIADELGITRRNTPRVPILGFFDGERVDTHVPVKAKVITISEGGIGLTDAVGFSQGIYIKGLIKSPNLNSDIHVHAAVVYMGNDNYVGLKFTSISPEAKSQIIEYVNKFSDDKS